MRKIGYIILVFFLLIGKNICYSDSVKAEEYVGHLRPMLEYSKSSRGTTDVILSEVIRKTVLKFLKGGEKGEANMQALIKRLYLSGDKESLVNLKVILEEFAPDNEILVRLGEYIDAIGTVDKEKSGSEMLSEIIEETVDNVYFNSFVQYRHKISDGMGFWYSVETDKNYEKNEKGLKILIMQLYNARNREKIIELKVALDNKLLKAKETRAPVVVKSSLYEDLKYVDRILQRLDSLSCKSLVNDAKGQPSLNQNI